MKEEVREYHLLYRLMSGIDGTVDGKIEEEVIPAATDVEAVQKANERLKERGSQSSVVPYAPMLFRGQSHLIADSNPTHPPTAHSLRLLVRSKQ